MIEQVVTRQIPKEILEGLANGSLKDYGGHVRDLAGRIRAHLIFKNVDAMEHVSKQLGGISGQLGQANQQLNLLQGLQTATLALQGLNLGVSVVGFAIVCHKLNSISQHLVKMEQKLDDLLDAHNRAEWKHELARQATLHANLMNLSSGLRTGDGVRVGDAMNRIGESAHYYRQLGDGLCRDLNQAFRSADVVHQVLTTASASTLALAHAHAVRGDIDEALLEVQGLAKWQSKISKKIDEPFSSDIVPPWLGRSEIQATKQLWQPMVYEQRSAPEGIAYAENIYTLCRERSIDVNALSSLTTDEKPFAFLEAA
jgi:hypothetical protein